MCHIICMHFVHTLRIFLVFQVDVCSPNPCQHNGTCFPNDASFICNCQPGVTGPHCETPTVVDVCLSNPCRNGGSCEPAGLRSVFMCHCLNGWAGELCILKVNACRSFPCPNGQQCIMDDRYEGYLCRDKGQSAVIYIIY